MKTKTSPASKNFTNRLISILDYYLYHIVINKDYKKTLANDCVHNLIHENHLTAA
ncbi:hypothetical protein [Aestuariivivens marinum]|uniref:hypothetical protein n=1 Tax=Aestuariivivens marinum TaxID=2913555 RepID=UPI001F55C5A2|nr:hypothetical protein [Aestuariivivens marinum]